MTSLSNKATTREMGVGVSYPAASSVMVPGAITVPENRDGSAVVCAQSSGILVCCEKLGTVTGSKSITT